MPQAYDSLASSAETRAKQRILGAMKKGFVLSSKGEFLKPIPLDNAEVAAPEEIGGVASSPSCVDKTSTTSMSTPPSLRGRCGGAKVVQVQNTFSLKIHLSTGGRTLPR